MKNCREELGYRIMYFLITLRQDHATSGQNCSSLVHHLRCSNHALYPASLGNTSTASTRNPRSTIPSKNPNTITRTSASG